MDAIIGVIGTILGTILGWILNALSHCGKIHIYLARWENNFQPNILHIKEPINILGQVSIYRYGLSLEIYNSSGSPHIIRDIEILFRNGKKVLYKSTPSDANNSQEILSIDIGSRIPALNISPKQIITVNLQGNIIVSDECNNSFWDTDNISLSYKGKNNRERINVLLKENFSKYKNNNCESNTENI